MNIILVDDANILLTCVCSDPEPPTTAWPDLPVVHGWTNGWNAVKDFKLPAKLPGWAKDFKLPVDWIFYINYNQAAVGRSGRAGYVEKIAAVDRTPEGLAAITANEPEQEFVVWWELCKSKRETADMKEKLKKNKQKEKVTKRK